MRRSVLITLLFGSVGGSWTTAGMAQDRSAAEEAVRAVVQAQADAFNRGDLVGTMATLGPDVDWRTIQTEWIDGHAAVTEAMSGWIDGMVSNNVRLVYPEEDVRVDFLSEDHAAVDVVLTWDVGPGNPPLGETLFFVLSRVDGEWLIVHVRNTTTHECAASGVCGG